VKTDLQRDGDGERRGFAFDGEKERSDLQRVAGGEHLWRFDEFAVKRRRGRRAEVKM
jgi:hypothetical protein